VRSCAEILMALSPGDRLGPYEIQSLLGVGGMGEVYRGRDTRLGRDVALKVISPKFVGDPSLRRRFEVEARAASVLNHPSIVTIYDVGEAGPVSWIAMEWVEGRTLREALLPGPLPLREAVAVFRQTAEGLAAAHAKGIVHRDLKPENIMLTADGRSKILDFGLARQTIVDALEGSMSGVNTVAGAPAAGTIEGSILGTVGYMSPEQASGLPLDFRSDQFALGLIAYEILAGRRAFAHRTAVETLSAVIREEPPALSTLRGDVPPALQELISRCLAKSPEDRFSSTRDLAAALESLASGLSAASFAPTELGISPPAPSPPASPRRRFRGRTVAVFGAALVLAVAAGLWLRSRAPSSPISSLAVLPFETSGKDPDARYLGEGLAESLIEQMSRVPSLRVMARSTVSRLAGTDPLEAGKKLGVGAVLTGSVSRRAGALSISAELVDISTGARIWGGKFDRKPEDLQAVQDAIALEISNGLHLKLSGPQKLALNRHGTRNPEAFDLFLKARHAFATETEDGYLEARRLYQQAVKRDPSFAEAHLGVASTYSAMAADGYARPAEMWPEADQEITKAIALDPDSVHGRLFLANRRFFGDWDWKGSEREYAKLAGDPRIFSGDMFRPVALFYWARGRTEEAIAVMERALKADSANLTSKINMADFLAQAGRLEEAIGIYKEALEAAPSDARAFFSLADVFKRRGDIAGAIQNLRKAYELTGEEAGASALAGARTEKDYESVQTGVARSHLAGLEALERERYVSPLDIARLQALTGDREKAFRSLEAAFAERSVGLVYLKADQAWDRLRDDVRFAELVKRVGIP
jgi:serine/threonine protein kinase/tetratricopeptide (TPR) repeat protein